ncbi:flagellar motor switch protein [Paracidovorax avenae]|uniref:FliM/FliN family flagellar motor switch protein n=1 Tax=Paracidovorax avenae TaxID=80867 RepID=UPI000D227D52|nr:FliM/FliN family flagellar motor switch protein [Paracidovorax avenae]AVS67164.1 flagellar motor switch protein [Paracidovorax avenae]
MPQSSSTPGTAPTPAPSNETPQVQPIALPPLAEPVASAATEPLLPSFQPLHQVRTTLQVCVGSATVTVGDLLAAQAQQVLVLDRGVDQAVDLVLEGQVVARGLLVAVGDRFAVKLTELPAPLSLQPSAA